MKTTAIAPSNIAFTKYWGKHIDPVLEKGRVPRNGSISMTLDSLLTTTTVEFDGQYNRDEFVLNGEVEEREESRVVQYLDLIRAEAKIDLYARVVSSNTFPKGTGLSSSASGFAALALAGSKAAGLDLNERALSILARKGSGSASRSIPSGFVEWHAADSSEGSFAETIFQPDHWSIVDVVAVVNEGRKAVSTTQGMQSTKDNPFIDVRIARMQEKNRWLKEILADKDFAAFGDLIEHEALELHAMMLAAGLIYLQPESLRLILKVQREWRPSGIAAFCTVNTGQDVHIICEEKDVSAVQAKLKEMESVHQVIINRPGKGARLTDQHLF